MSDRHSAGIDPVQRMRLRRALPWLYTLRLPAWAGALAGGAAGALVGLLIVFNMRRHTVFTGPHQERHGGGTHRVVCKVTQLFNVRQRIHLIVTAHIQQGFGADFQAVIANHAGHLMLHR